MLILVIVLLVLFGGIGVYSYRRPRPYGGYRFNLFRRRPRQVPPPPRPNRPMDYMGPGPQMNNGPMNSPRGGQPMNNGPRGPQGNPGGPRGNGPTSGGPSGRPR